MLLKVISVLHLKQPISLVDGELRHHRARGENCPVQLDVVAVGSLEDPPVLQAAVEGLVTTADCIPRFLLGLQSLLGT